MLLVYLSVNQTTKDYLIPEVLFVNGRKNIYREKISIITSA